jgi:hypothetical protein
MHRRSFTVAALAAAAAPLSAQTPWQAVAVFSLLGDTVQVTSADEAPSDTRIQRSSRETLDTKDIGFDIIASTATLAALSKAKPQARSSSLRVNAALDVAAQRRIADAAARGELPGWMVNAIVERKLTQVLLITRDRGETDLRTGDNIAIGRGTSEGIGFYLDTLYRMQNSTTGVTSLGLIGSYAHLRLTLLDTQTAQVLASHVVHQGYAHAAPDNRVDADPWSFLSPAQKVVQLRRLVETAVASGMQQLLRGQ